MDEVDITSIDSTSARDRPGPIFAHASALQNLTSIRSLILIPADLGMAEPASSLAGLNCMSCLMCLVLFMQQLCSDECEACIAVGLQSLRLRKLEFYVERTCFDVIHTVLAMAALEDLLIRSTGGNLAPEAMCASHKVGLSCSLTSLKLEVKSTQRGW